MEQPIEKIYTYEDLLALGDDVRAELIDGQLYMTATPARAHQRISFELGRQIGNFLTDKPCEAYTAPFDVDLSYENKSDDEIEIHLQPDLAVICDHSKFTDSGCKGAPDLVIEILSPSSISHDRFVKFNLYQQAKVREYWIVSPFENSVEVYVLGDDEKFQRAAVYSRDEKAVVNVLPGCVIDLSAVFPAG